MRARTKYRLTRLGWLYYGIGAILFVSSISSQSGLLLVPVGILAGVFLANLLHAARSVRGVAVHPPRLLHVSEGHRLTQPWKLTNAGGAATGLEARNAAGVLFRVPSLAAKGSASLVPDLTFLRRGVFPLEAVLLASRAPFGFVEVTRRLVLEGEVVVHPAVYPVAPPRAAGFDVMVGGRFRGRRQTASGDHFAGVRPQQPGDSLRQIHWASSAKGLGLMVKTFEEELSGRVALVLAVRPGEAGEQVDDAIRAAGSLAFAALDEGHHVELAEVSSGGRRLIAPFDDGQELLDYLARLNPPGSPPTAEDLVRALALTSPRSALHLLMTSWDEAFRPVLEAELARGRRVTLHLPEGASAATMMGVPVWRFAARTMRESE